MDDVASGRPPLEGRGVMLIDDFSRATGLDRQTTDALVMDRKVDGLLDADGGVFGLFDDALPTSEELHSFGLTPRDDYDPELLRSFVVADDDLDLASDEDGADSEAASWSMSWGDTAP
jgi:hypothetical protein